MFRQDKVKHNGMRLFAAGLSLSVFLPHLSAPLSLFSVFTCIRAVGEKQSGVEMQLRDEESCRIGGWDSLWRTEMNSEGNGKQNKMVNLSMWSQALSDVQATRPDADDSFGYAFPCSPES